MIKTVLFTIIIACFIALTPSAFQAAQGEPNCHYGNTVSELFQGDTYVGNYLLPRDENGFFQTTEPRMKELTVYLNSLNLAPVIAKVHVILRKSLTYYEPYHTDHHGKAWYDHSGNLIAADGDRNLLKNWTDANYKKVKMMMIEWEMRHFWGPFVLYENEETGKDVFDAEIVFLDKNDCWLTKVIKNYYRLPQKDTPVNLDNVDAGTDEWQVVLFSRSKNQYISIEGGTSPLYPKRAKELRREWDAIHGQKFTWGSSNNNSAGHYMEIDGKKIIYNAVIVYPNMTEPKISLVYDNKKAGYYLIVELPKYFQGRFIPAFIGIEYIDGNTMSILVVRGAIKQIFVVPISNNPTQASIDWIKN